MVRLSTICGASRMLRKTSLKPISPIILMDCGASTASNVVLVVKLSAPAQLLSKYTNLCFTNCMRNSVLKGMLISMYQLASEQIKDWDQILTEFPDAHILQTLQWAELKKQNGWSPMFFWSGSRRHDPDALVMVLRKQVNFLGMKFTVLYAPKGPTLDWSYPAAVNQTLDFLQALCRKQKAIFIKIDPDVLLGTGIPGSEDEKPNENGLALQKELKNRGWQFSKDQIQYRNTVLVDL